MVRCHCSPECEMTDGPRLVLLAPFMAALGQLCFRQDQRVHDSMTLLFSCPQSGPFFGLLSDTRHRPGGSKKQYPESMRWRRAMQHLVRTLCRMFVFVVTFFLWLWATHDRHRGLSRCSATISPPLPISAPTLSLPPLSFSLSLSPSLPLSRSRSTDIFACKTPSHCLLACVRTCPYCAVESSFKEQACVCDGPLGFRFAPSHSLSQSLTLSLFSFKRY